MDIKENADGRVHMPFLQRVGLLNGCESVVKTPSGGFHLYFPASQGVLGVLGNKGRAGTLGLDVRGVGGYVIAPPSFLSTDNLHGPYVDLGPTTGSSDEPLLWDLIVSALTPIDTETKKPVDLLPSERRASVAALREWVTLLQPGERNNGLHWAVCRCIDNGIDPHEMVEPALLVGLEEDEVRATIGSALKRAGLSANELESEAEALFPDVD